LYASGGSQSHLTITGNTIKNASWKSPGDYSGIHLKNTRESVVNGNIVIDDAAESRMKVAIEEVGECDYNLIANNQVSEGTAGAILITGANTTEKGNQVRSGR
jgi:hypothetical protein